MAVVSRSDVRVSFVRLRNALLCSAAATFCLIAGPASAQQAITTPIFTSVGSDQNFRDLAGFAVAYGGTGFADTTSHGGAMRTGVFYRSEALSTGSLNATDRAILTSLNIGMVLDLRTDSERSVVTTPDPMAPNNGPDQSIGAREVWVNIYDLPSPPTPPTSDAKNFMITSYQNFVANPNEVQKFREALLELAHETGSSLYHCSGGKDRTGWTSMLLQTIAGVNPTTIMNGYLATNQYMATGIAHVLSGISDPNTNAAVAVLLGVQQDFLNAGLTQISTTYGSMWNYLTASNGLALTLEDIYVLRAKMVYYQSLPGQGGFVGNAAAGAAFLNALQNSPLSGSYTNFNYYLQSAIDAGTLGGIEAQIGGQVHADAAAFVLRQPVLIEAATALYADGRDLGVGQFRLWMTGLGEYFKSDGRTGVAGSSERSAGTLAGATHRLSQHASAYFGLGFSSGSVGSAGASVDIDTAIATFGGRYGLSTLDVGPYVAARAHLGWIDYRSKRSLGGGLGVAEGDTNGAVYSGRIDVGNVVRWDQFTVTPQIGFRASHVRMSGFGETGSELALAVDTIKHTYSSVVADLDIAFNPRQIDGWSVVPSAKLGYELALDDPRIESVGTLYDVTITQSSAYDSRHLAKFGVAFTAQREALTVKAGVNAARGEASSAGVNAQVTVSYRF